MHPNNVSGKDWVIVLEAGTIVGPSPHRLRVAKATLERKLARKYDIFFRAHHFLVLEGYDPRIHSVYFCPQLYRYDSDETLVPLEGQEIGQLIALNVESGVAERQPWYEPTQKFPGQPIISAPPDLEEGAVMLQLPAPRRSGPIGTDSDNSEQLAESKASADLAQRSEERQPTQSKRKQRKARVEQAAAALEADRVLAITVRGTRSARLSMSSISSSPVPRVRCRYRTRVRIAHASAYVGSLFTVTSRQETSGRGRGAGATSGRERGAGRTRERANLMRRSASSRTSDTRITAPCGSGTRPAASKSTSGYG
jgi:hypothetical protein